MKNMVKCPKCGSTLKEFGINYQCENENCDYLEIKIEALSSDKGQIYIIPNEENQEDNLEDDSELNDSK